MIYQEFYLPVSIAIAGLSSGLYTLSKAKKLPKDKILILDFVLMGLVDIYVGFIYLAFISNAISSLEELSQYIRPAMLLLITLPAIITWRMGVSR